MNQDDMTKDKLVAVIGVGGLGCNASQLLARQGFRLRLIDGDIIEPSNLDRQVLFRKDDIGKNKVDVARDMLQDFTEIDVLFETINEQNTDLLEDADIILDCTDNAETREILDEYCVKARKPWVYSAGVKEIGVLYFVDPSDETRASYNTFSRGKYGESACEVGVMNTTVSIIGSFAAKIVSDFLRLGKYPEDLVRVDLDNMEIQKIRV